MMDSPVEILLALVAAAAAFWLTLPPETMA